MINTDRNMGDGQYETYDTTGTECICISFTVKLYKQPMGCDGQLAEQLYQGNDPVN